MIIENFEISKTVAKINKPGRVAVLREGVAAAWRQFYVRSTAALTNQLTLNTETGKVDVRRTSSTLRRKGSAASQQIRSNLQESGLLSLAQQASDRHLNKAQTYRHLLINFDDGHERSLYLCGPKNSVRRVFIRLANSKAFETVVFVAIFGSSLMLSLQTPVDDDPEVQQIVSSQLQWRMDVVFTILFTLEFLIRVIANGLVSTLCLTAF